MSPVSIITGGAKRIGAEIARYLHDHHYNIVIHYNKSFAEAKALAADLNKLRIDSAVIVQGDLLNENSYIDIVNAAINQWGCIDVLINNASLFLHTPFLKSNSAAWDNMLTTNVKASYFLSQLVAPHLSKNKGSIINISDIYANIPKYEHSIYSLTKAALNSMTKSLAQELAPNIRVNAIAPGAILLANTNTMPEIMPDTSLLKYKPCAKDIAEAVYFAMQHKFLTGQIIQIDGGASVNNF